MGRECSAPDSRPVLATPWFTELGSSSDFDAAAMSYVASGAADVAERCFRLKPSKISPLRYKGERGERATCGRQVAREYRTSRYTTGRGECKPPRRCTVREIRLEIRS